MGSVAPITRTNRKARHVNQSTIQQVIEVKADGSVDQMSEKETIIGEKEL